MSYAPARYSEVALAVFENTAAAAGTARFVADSLLEGGGFEPSVPRRRPSPPWPLNCCSREFPRCRLFRLSGAEVLRRTQVAYAASKKESSSATAREKKSRHRSACAGPTRSNSVRRKSTNPRKFGLSCSVIHSACTKLFRQRLRRAGGPIEIQPFGHHEDRKRGRIAARLRRFAHDRLEAYGRLRIRIGLRAWSR